MNSSWSVLMRRLKQLTESVPALTRNVSRWNGRFFSPFASPADSLGGPVSCSSVSAFFLGMVSLLSVVVTANFELNPLPQMRVFDAGDPVADAAVLGRKAVVGAPGVVPALEPASVPLAPLLRAGHCLL